MTDHEVDFCEDGDSHGTPCARAGVWRGFYTYTHDGQRHVMQAQLSLHGGRIQGRGRDDVGEFAIDGAYTSDGRCRFLKAYLLANSVEYEGYCESGSISGRWALGSPGGWFHLWSEGAATDAALGPVPFGGGSAEGPSISLPGSLAALTRAQLTPPFDLRPVDVVVRTDDKRQAQRLIGERLRGRVRGQVAYRRLPWRRPSGFRLHAPADRRQAAAPIAAQVRAAMAAHQVHDVYALREHFDDARAVIVVDLPLQETTDPSLLERILRSRSRYPLELVCSNPQHARRLAEELRGAGWRPRVAVAPVDRRISRPTLRAGDVPDELIADMSAHVWAHFRCELEVQIDRAREGAWLELSIPAWDLSGLGPVTNQGRTESGAEAIQGGVHIAGAMRPFLDTDSKDVVCIGELVLPKRYAAPSHVPAMQMLENFCIDEPTAATLAFLAQSKLTGEVSLLTGDTSAGKTGVSALFAALLRQPFLRIAHRPDAEPDAPIGRYRPAKTGDAAGPQFVWVDGPLLIAMRNGGIVCHDEINLSRTECVEALTSTLEKPPSLVVADHDYEVLGPGGTPVHDDFMVIATRNPETYQGRAAMSVALLNRFRSERLVPSPSERDYLHMLRLLVHGEQPEIEVDGVEYRAWKIEQPKFAALQGVPGVDAFLEALARFHASLGHAARNSNGTAHSAAERREHSRATLASVLGFIDRMRSRLGGDFVCVRDRALARYYLEHVAPERHEEIVRLMQASDLAPRDRFGAR